MLGTRRGPADCDGLCAKGKVIKISGFLAQFYVAITWKSYRKKTSQILSFAPEKEIRLIGPELENLYFNYDTKVILMPRNG